MPMVLTERDGAVALLTLNNPAQYNALDMQLMRELQQALEQALADPAVRVVLLTGAGKGFCSGAQFGGDTFEQGEAIGAWMRQSINPLIERLRQSPSRWSPPSAYSAPSRTPFRSDGGQRSTLMADSVPT